jgi:hypothetical protein
VEGAEKRNAHRILVSRPDGKRIVGRQRYRSVDYIKRELNERG